MSYNESTHTMNIGNDDWLKASEDMQIRSYLPHVSDTDITVVPVKQDIHFMGFKIPVHRNEDYEDAELAEEGGRMQDEELEKEDEEFLTQLKEYHDRRFSEEW